MALPVLSYLYPGWKKNARNAADQWGDGFAINTTGFADRMPLHGWYDESDPAITDKLMRDDVKAGRTGWCICWSFDTAKNIPVGDHVVNNVMASSVQGLKFCIGFETSYAEFAGASVENWNKMLLKWDEYFSNPKYLRINGRPVVFVIKPDTFESRIVATTGMTHRQLLDNARTRCQENIYFVFCSELLAYWMGVAQDAGYDCWSAYNIFKTWTKRDSFMGDPTQGPQPNNYLELVANYKIERDYAVKNLPAAMQYWLPMTVGFDNRAWGGTTALPSTIDQHTAHMQDCLNFANSHPGKVVGIVEYAKNEHGEGGVTEPTFKDGRARNGNFKRIFNP